MLDYAQLLRDHVELLADLHAKLDERVTIMCAETFGFGQFVPHDLSRQVRIERFALAPFLARVRSDRRLGEIFLSRCAVRAQHFGFVKQAELILIARLALCAEQLAAVGTESLLSEIALRSHEPQSTA